MELKTVTMEIPEGCNIILGQAHFIKTIDDLYELLATTIPSASFGVAFSEASGPCLIRHDGNSEDLTAAAVRNLEQLECGHVFCILMRDAFPISVLTRIRECPEVCHVFCATANPLEVIVAKSEQGSGVCGVVDGFPPRGVETGEDQAQRKMFLRKIGYKR